jgi:hypothetical protein
VHLPPSLPAAATTDASGVRFKQGFGPDVERPGSVARLAAGSEATISTSRPSRVKKPMSRSVTKRVSLPRTRSETLG